ncbi:ATP-binding protein [Neorhizobium galegae]|uniref:ATP-binding protein n=1 Tax=Neorhizobium galegae TaxID=399 RepID=A0A6A1TU64_NEOGA|nr:ATP-binding protein [Neorhizobium galegae]KAB1087575.1 ATP-binding protein [Neorhizobium galegae]
MEKPAQFRVKTNTYHPEFLEAAQAIFDMLPPEAQNRVKRLGKHNQTYIRSTRDQKLSAVMDRLRDNAAAAVFGGSEKRRAMFVIGDSDSGKSRALAEMVANRPEFKPRASRRGVTRPFVFFEAPKPLTIKGFARKALEECGYPAKNLQLQEWELFDLLKDQIRDKGVIFMWVDEMQHVLHGNTTDAIQNVSDIVKSLLQIPGWPLHLILSGVPSLAKFLVPKDGDRQLRNRSYLVHLNPITAVNAEMMLKLQEKIMEKDGLAVDETDTPEFMERLIHSCHGAFGTMIKRMQAAAEQAISAAEKQVRDEAVDSLTITPIPVTMKHYASVYELETGASEHENIFSQGVDWKNITPLAALTTIIGSIPSTDKPRRRRFNREDAD